MQHHFDIDIAKKFGVNVAIFLENIAYWTLKNIANNTHFYDNHYWTYNTVQAFTQLFPYWSTQELRTIILKCKDNNLLIEGSYNKVKYDKTKWYALTDPGLLLFNLKAEITITQSQPHLLESTNEAGGHLLIPTNGFVDSNKPIPDRKQQIENNNRYIEKISFPEYKKLENQELSETEKLKIDYKKYAIEHELCIEAFETFWKDTNATIEQAYDTCQLYWETKGEITNWATFKTWLMNEKSIKPFRSIKLNQNLSTSVKTTRVVESENNRQPQYQEYVGRMKADINLKLLPENFEILNFSDWLRKG